MNHTTKIQIQGIVQGVGFRPFVYRIATEHSLSGYVLNCRRKVEIVVTGSNNSIDRFLSDLQTKNPPLSRIYSIETTQIPLRNFRKFTIRTSKKHSGTGSSIIPPDTGICDDCLSELFNPSDRRYLYSFTVCTNCGPRYTTVSDLPYDRGNTTMIDFPLCDACDIEYRSPEDRRYHAQPTCCPACGPVMLLYDRRKVLIETGNSAIEAAASHLDRGEILAIKGIGGIHIATLATDDAVLIRLRERLGRCEQPFAVMAGDLNSAKEFASASPVEEMLLTDCRKPIVILEKSGGYDLSEQIAPLLHNIGVMLPYSPVHYLLFHYGTKSAYVVTSANRPGLPMAIENEEAFLKLAGIVDYYLLHNRRIANRTDDSVVRVVGDNPSFVRRSRGYVPEPIELPFEVEPVIGVGAELQSAVTIAKGRYAYISQYIGNTKKIETFEYHNEVARHLKKLTGIDPSRYACDLHPLFNTTRYASDVASRSGQPLIRVQHHQAHLASLMADNQLPVDSRIIGIALDGVGYGTDGTAWGGEIMEVNYHGFVRHASLKSQPMAGGDLVAYYPSRMVLGMLYGMLDEQELRNLDLRFRYGNEERTVVLRQLAGGINLSYTTSMGRVLDAVAALLGICYHRSYDGEPAMKLESVARGGSDVNAPSFSVVFSKEEERGGREREVLDTSQILLEVCENIGKFSRADLAYAAEDVLARGVAYAAVRAAEKIGINVVGLSGGVAYNDHIACRIKEIVEGYGYEFITHNRVPCGDSGISLGQVVVAGIQSL
jgi:hydrogenase maturation protein HypF